MSNIPFVTVFVIRHTKRDWEFLQILRAPGRYMENTWNLVSGGIEPDEPAWRAAVRELREEASLTPLELYTVPHVGTFYLHHNDSLCHSLDFCAVVAPDAQVILNNEHTDYRWIPADRIESMLIWPGQRAGARQVLNEIIANGPSKAYSRIDRKLWRS